MKQPRAIIVPARKQKASDPAYTNMTGALKRAGYAIVPYDIIWNSKVMSEWVDELSAIVKSEDSPVTLCGFSLGGMVCLLTATKVPVQNLILCSPSGYFNEYLGELPLIDRRLMGDFRWAEFSELSAPETLKKLQVQHGQVLAQEGDFANPGAARWLNDLIETTQWKLTRIPYGTNGINNPNYQRTILEIVKGLPPIAE